jgi:hypothetical protein
MPFDARQAWVGVYNKDRTESVRVEAAAWQGRPVYFDIQSGPDPQERNRQSNLPRPAWVLGITALLTVCICGALLARSNLRAGRGDRKGAARIATFSFACQLLAWTFRASHVPDPWEILLLIGALGQFALAAGFLWLSYLGVEPYMRRYWPESLISWNRLQSGRIDRLVASHILAGITMWFVVRTGFDALSLPIRTPQSVWAFDSAANFAAFLTLAPYRAVNGMGFFLVAVVVLRMLARRRLWIADVLACLVFTQVGAQIDFSTPYYFALTASYSFAATYGLLWLIRRFGFAATLSALMGQMLLTPLSLGAWYTGYSLVALLIPVGIAAWAVWVIVSDARTASPQSALAPL